MVTRGIIQETISKVILVIAGFVLNIILARELGPSEYGIVGITLSIMFVIEPLLTNGLRQAVSKILSSEQVNTKRLWHQSFLLQMVFSFVLVAVGLLVLGLIAEWLNLTEYKNMLYLILAIIPVKGIFFLNLGFLNGQFKYKQHALANSLYSIFRLIISLAIFYATHNGVLAILGGTLGAYLLAMLFTKIEWTTPDSTKKITTGYLLNLTWGALLFYLLINVFLYIDVLLLRGMGSTEAVIGYYKACTNIGSLLYFLFLSVSQVSYPLIAKLFTQQIWSEIKKVVSTLILSISYTTFLAFVLTFFFSEIIVKIFFGTSYLPATGVIPWYILGIGALSIVILMGNMMITFEHRKTYLLYLLGSFLFYLITFYLLFGKLGIYTPPISLFSASILSIVVLINILNRKYPQLFDIKSLLVNIGWLVLMSAAAVLLNQYLALLINRYIAGILIFGTFTLVSFLTIRQVREAVMSSAIILLGKKKHPLNSPESSNQS